MISMSQTYSIRQLRKSGESISEIARKVGVSRNTVYAKLAAPDLSPQMPVKEPREKLLDAYRPVIEGYLDEDERGWRKQRHTARRIWQRLRDEHGVACSESTVRHYVHDLKAQRRGVAESYLDLVWSPGEAQADFGEADFAVVGARRRMSFFVLSFPFSNMGFAQVFPSENAECVCQALKQIFEYVESFNERLMGRCYSLSKSHYLKGEDEKQLFVEDSVAMAGLPEAAFTVVRYAHCKADKQGKVCVDGPHRYSTDPSLAGRRVIVGLGATAVTVYTESG